jgi:hypothetical protein
MKSRNGHHRCGFFITQNFADQRLRRGAFRLCRKQTLQRIELAA